MKTEKFADLYVQYEKDIKNILEDMEIFDMDILHDTYIALFEHAEKKNRINNFKNAYVAFYVTRYLRHLERESYFEAYDDEQFYRLNIADESDLEYREQIGRRIDKIIRYYSEHPQPGERCHRQSVKVLRQFRQGLTEREISNKVKISHQAVHQSLERTIERLKACQEMAI